jgi:hypothetical protein
LLFLKANLINRLGKDRCKTVDWDLYKEGSVSSSVGSDAFTLEDGVAVFDIHMPDESGEYMVSIYSEKGILFTRSIPIGAHRLITHDKPTAEKFIAEVKKPQ